MNTIARSVSVQPFFDRVSFIKLNKAHVGLFFLCAAIFFSAFSIVYAKDMNRRLYISAQATEHQNALAIERWSKLLLERSALMAQPRVEKIASYHLSMVLPGSKNIQLVRSGNKQGRNG